MRAQREGDRGWDRKNDRQVQEKFGGREDKRETGCQGKVEQKERKGTVVRKGTEK